MKSEGFYRIVVPTDFSTCSHEAWALARRLAGAFGSELIPIRVLVEEPARWSESPFNMDRVREVYETARIWGARGARQVGRAGGGGRPQGAAGAHAPGAARGDRRARHGRARGPAGDRHPRARGHEQSAPRQRGRSRGPARTLSGADRPRAGLSHAVDRGRAVRDWMSRKPAAVQADSPIGAAVRADAGREVRHLLVMEGDRLTGIPPAGTWGASWATWRRRSCPRR